MTSAWQPVSGDPAGNPFRYQTKWNIAEAYEITSHYNDRNMHLYDFGLRFYHPRHGRFINRDPIGEAGGLNLYAYVGNDPVNLGDFLGLDVIDGGTILISYPTGVSGDPFSDFANGFFDYDTVLLSKPRLPEVTIPEPDRNEASSSPSSQGSTRSEILSVHARSQVWMIARMRHSNSASGGRISGWGNSSPASGSQIDDYAQRRKAFEEQRRREYLERTGQSTSPFFRLPGDQSKVFHDELQKGVQQQAVWAGTFLVAGGTVYAAPVLVGTARLAPTAFRAISNTNLNLSIRAWTEANTAINLVSNQASISIINISMQTGTAYFGGSAASFALGYYDPSIGDAGLGSPGDFIWWASLGASARGGLDHLDYWFGGGE